MNNSVRGRDMWGEPCLICEEGAYIIEATMLPDGEDVLECTACDDIIPRHMTKKDILQHILGDD